MEPDSEIFRRLGAIEWFSKCESEPDPALGPNVIWVPDWYRARESFSDPNWEDTTLQARNALTMHLAARNQTAFQEWNALTRKARDRIVREIMPTVEEFQNQHHLPEVFSQCTRWDILGAVMEETYKSLHPPRFFETLLRIYERGRFPCGWKGEWPNGKLLVI